MYIYIGINIKLSSSDFYKATRRTTSAIISNPTATIRQSSQRSLSPPANLNAGRSGRETTVSPGGGSERVRRVMDGLSRTSKGSVAAIGVEGGSFVADDSGDSETRELLRSSWFFLPHVGQDQSRDLFKGRERRQKKKTSAIYEIEKNT
jgi:hypothetical protein